MKYHAIKTTIDGITFASKKEATRYQELKLLQQVGEIELVRLQPVYTLRVNDIDICKYIADFLYYDKTKNKFVTEDVKGVKTPVYRLKKKLMKAIYNIDIYET